jgi:hypothetical protein
MLLYVSWPNFEFPLKLSFFSFKNILKKLNWKKKQKKKVITWQEQVEKGFKRMEKRTGILKKN